MVRVLTTHTHKTKVQKKNFRGDGYVYFLDCGAGIMSVYI